MEFLSARNVMQVNREAEGGLVLIYAPCDL